MAGEEARDIDSYELTKKAAVEYPWWVKAYSRFLYTSHPIFLALVFGISYFNLEGEQV